MSYSREHNIKFRVNNNRNQNDSFEKTRYDEKFEIINKVQSQNGVRGQLLVFQSSFDLPYTVLQNAVYRINGLLAVNKIEQNKGSSKFRLVVNNEILAEDSYESLSEAKQGLAKLALSNLSKSCFTIFRKIHPRDSPKIDLASPSYSNSNSAANTTDATTNIPPQATPSSMGGIGSKLIMQMGWSGGGLGAQEQGHTTIVQPYLQIQRQGLGAKNITKDVLKVLQDYAASRDFNSIAFSPEFTKEERVVIHEVARKLNLKSRSYGEDSDRIVVVQSKVRPWDLIYSLLETGGETDQLKLILPTDFDK